MFPTEILVDIHPPVNTSILSTITYQPPIHLSAQRYRERSAATWSPLKTSGFTPSNVSTANSHTVSISNQQSISELLDIIYPYLIFVIFLHTHILSPENFTLGKCVNFWQICTATKQRKSPTQTYISIWANHEKNGKAGSSSLSLFVTIESDLLAIVTKCLKVLWKGTDKIQSKPAPPKDPVYSCRHKQAEGRSNG